jgi:hypothetical protein
MNQQPPLALDQQQMAEGLQLQQQQAKNLQNLAPN